MINPKVLALVIILSFISLCGTIGGCDRPDTLVGILFWISFAVFAASCIHLAKNDKYYKDYIDEHLR